MSQSSTSDYLAGNLAYWSQGYEADNVDHPVFRFYGRILKVDWGLDGSGGERLLDFGCGGGAAVNFFAQRGFDAYGVDMSETDLERARGLYPDLRDRFLRIDPKPRRADVWFGGDFKVITSIQALYYLANTDLETRLWSLYEQLDDDGVFYATMIGTESSYYEGSRPAEDGLREVRLQTPRIKIEDYYVNFVSSHEEVAEKFHMFEPVHEGFYSEKFRSDEGKGFHFLFVGRKRLRT